MRMTAIWAVYATQWERNHIMAAWADMSLPAPSSDMFRQYPQKGQVKTEFENGAVQSRARATSTRWVFVLGWRALGQTDYATLCTFFDSNLGTTFAWVHPITSVSYTVRFTEGRLPDAVPSGFTGGETAWQISGLQLEEA